MLTLRDGDIAKDREIKFDYTVLGYWFHSIMLRYSRMVIRLLVTILLVNHMLLARER